MCTLFSPAQKEREEREPEAEEGSPCKYLAFGLPILNAGYLKGESVGGERGARRRDLALGQLFIACVGRQTNLGACCYSCLCLHAFTFMYMKHVDVMLAGRFTRFWGLGAEEFTPFTNAGVCDCDVWSLKKHQ